MENETWKPIPGFESTYSVSDLGRIKRIKSNRVLRSYLNKFGYPLISLSKNNVQYRRSVHRLVMLAFVGSSELTVDHLNGIVNDNRLVNLEYVSLRENVSRAYQRKRGLPTGVQEVNGRFLSHIVIKNKLYHLGVFDTIELASDTYQAASNDIENIDKYTKKQKFNPLGKGISKVKNRYRVVAYMNGKKVQIGSFMTLSEAQAAYSNAKQVSENSPQFVHYLPFLLPILYLLQW